MQTVKTAHCRIFYRENLPPALAGTPHELLALFKPETLTKAAQVSYKGGRGQTALFELGGEKLVLRRYLRGGLWGRVMGDKFCRLFPLSRRAQLEFALTETLLHDGLPVPEPLVGLQENCWLFCRNALITRQIPESANLAEILARRKLTEVECRLIGSTLQRFFTAGVVHTDLNLRNILLCPSGCVLIDFDKCFKRPQGLKAGESEAMLKRLKRSFLKEKRLRPDTHFTLDAFAAIAAAAGA